VTILLPKLVRMRSKAHMAYVGRWPYCIACRRPSDRVAIQVHHITYAQPRARGLKSSDRFTVPICVHCHTALHADGNEERWWRKSVNFDPLAVAEAFWRLGPEKGRTE
jgi:hypothetical protein